METEVELKEQEKIQVSKHLGPIMHASDVALPGEDMVTVMVPKKFIITLSDGSRQRVDFPAGTYDIPKRLTKHAYLKANGVTVATAAGKKEAASQEEGVDLSLLAPDNLASMKFDQLKVAYFSVGGSPDDLTPQTSKAQLTEMITAKVDALKASK